MVSFLFVALFFSVIESDLPQNRVETISHVVLYCKCVSYFCTDFRGIFPNRRVTQDTGNSLRFLNSVIGELKNLVL